MHRCMHTYMHAYRQTSKHIQPNTQHNHIAYIHTISQHALMHTYTHTHTHIHTYTRTHIRTYTHTHIHTHIHTQHNHVAPATHEDEAEYLEAAIRAVIILEASSIIIFHIPLSNKLTFQKFCLEEAICAVEILEHRLAI